MAILYVYKCFVGVNYADVTENHVFIKLTSLENLYTWYEMTADMVGQVSLM